ncbi:MAG: hypothetical protein H7A43_09740 [Verrucomicrobia bacterium]|nr:hypothetical protein [Kiritimatiellia bacterium]MCP5488918.1 hypothetical protein [Verrucomicrobiota bacterium]
MTTLRLTVTLVGAFAAGPGPAIPGGTTPPLPFPLGCIMSPRRSTTTSLLSWTPFRVAAIIK